MRGHNGFNEGKCTDQLAILYLSYRSARASYQLENGVAGRDGSTQMPVLENIRPPTLVLFLDVLSRAEHCDRGRKSPLIPAYQYGHCSDGRGISACPFGAWPPDGAPWCSRFALTWIVGCVPVRQPQKPLSSTSIFGRCSSIRLCQPWCLITRGKFLTSTMPFVSCGAFTGLNF